MPKGISIHIGLNRVDPKHYGGWDGKLDGCIADAQDMAALAKAASFSPNTMLIDDKATASAVTTAIQNAARTLRVGDILLLTYSGHGGQVTDSNNDEEDDAKDETWCLYDRQLVDDELYALWSRFEPGTRIIVLSDSCHSGTVSKAIREYARMLPDGDVDSDFGALPMAGMRGGPPGQPAPVAKIDDVAALKGSRRMPPSVEERTEKENAQLYADIQTNTPDGERAAIGATVALISGCQDAQLSSDGPHNGLFTYTLKKVWKLGKYRGSYRSFAGAIQRQMPMYQQPGLFVVGPSNPAFLRQKPFTV